MSLYDGLISPKILDRRLAANKAVRAITASERRANRDAIRASVEAAVAAGKLRADTEIAGLATMLDGVLLGLSIQALDGATLACLDAAVTGALTAWDAYRSGDRPSDSIGSASAEVRATGPDLHVGGRRILAESDVRPVSGRPSGPAGVCAQITERP